MSMKPAARASMLALIAVMTCSPLLAEQGSDSLVPAGYDHGTRIGRVQVHTSIDSPLKAKSRAELSNRITVVRDTLYKTFGLGLDCARMGLATGLFEDRRQDAIDLIVFPSAEARREWEAAVGSATTRPHCAGYCRTVALALDGESIPNEEWASVCHDLAHAYLDVTVYSEIPAWLDEGFATYIAFTNRNVSVMDMPSFLDRIKLMAQRQDSKQYGAVADMLEQRLQPAGAIRSDQAWVLVDLLVRQGCFQSILSRLQYLDCVAVDGPAGVAADMRRETSRIILQSIGGPAKLQGAWDAMLNDLLSNPEKVTRSGVRLTQPQASDAMCILDSELRGKQEGARRIGHVETSRHLVGEVRYSGPGPADIQTALRVGDGKGRWSLGYAVQAWARLAPGNAVRLTEYDIPVLGDDRIAEFAMDVRVENGGRYRIIKEVQFRK